MSATSSISACSTPRICWRRWRSPRASGLATSRCRSWRRSISGLNGNAITVSPALHAAIMGEIEGDAVRSAWRPRWRCARRGQQAQERRGTADVRHDVPVLHPQLSAPVLDGGGRGRSRRGRSPGGAAAALHGGQPRQRPCRRVLCRRALEFGRGRSRRRPHPAFRLRHSGARGREGSGGPAKLVGEESGRAGGPDPGGCPAPPNSSRIPETAPRPRDSWRSPIGSASTPK